MTYDISQQAHTTWTARTTCGMVLVTIDHVELGYVAGGDLCAVRNDTGDIVAARLIGPLAGERFESSHWRIVGRYRVDASGEPMAEIAAATESATKAVQRHDWGALGLPNGLDTRVRPVDDPPGVDAVTLAHASSGHRVLDRNPLLTMTPGDRVAVDGNTGVVVSIDRRKHTVEIDRDGDVTVHDFDDVQTQETR